MAESWASSPEARARMQSNRSRDTKPELALRSAVHALGLRYRVAAKPLAGLRRTADLVFPTAKVAVFLDGCFWHGCPEHSTRPRANAEWWTTKLQANASRDADTTQYLQTMGWIVIRVWEHPDPSQAAQQIGLGLSSRTQPGG